VDMSSCSPSITTMIRMDHTHVFALFHRYKADTPDGRKRALLANACLALEVHAQLEEEIFYPALRRVISDDQVLNKSGPEHDEMRELIRALRDQLAAADHVSVVIDDTFLKLMRAVIHDRPPISHRRARSPARDRGVPTVRRSQ